ncbi:hypothetical protein ATANTOWER_015248 [Ataeniobius toweri]|uniref:Uncharacterized protein n=1 Tax=Ataeniobius toweri TaxID=208326 RepID=A0ABU7AH75_9TELE|nr:hypothetical protein [Ataeniobius toweri]
MAEKATEKRVTVVSRMKRQEVEGPTLISTPPILSFLEHDSVFCKRKVTSRERGRYAAKVEGAWTQTQLH